MNSSLKVFNRARGRDRKCDCIVIYKDIWSSYVGNAYVPVDDTQYTRKSSSQKPVEEQ